MTAEIAILNKQGVALAADSAVSIGTKKVYNSANKLFALSKARPVGIMVFGNAEFMGTPWETIIKYYRATRLKQRSFDTLEKYYRDFIDFLSTTKIFDDEAEIGYIRQHSVMVMLHIRTAIEDAVKETLPDQSVSEKDIPSIIKQAIAKQAENIRSSKRSDRFTRGLASKVKHKHGKTIAELTGAVFEKLPLGAKDLASIVTCCIDALGAKKSWGTETGLVIAGFGEMEIFPSLANFEIEGRVFNYLKTQAEDTSKVTGTTGAIICPFAQREMVDMFMGGMDPQFEKAVMQSFDGALQKVPPLLFEKHKVKVGPKTLTDIQSDIEIVAGNLKEEISKFQQRNFIAPVLASVGALPLDELASMAKSLVNLTSFKRRVTMVPESVGGPIDVAVISKGDGFIWINRKHYFEPNLNHHYFDNAKRNGHESH